MQQTSVKSIKEQARLIGDGDLIGIMQETKISPY